MEIIIALVFVHLLFTILAFFLIRKKGYSIVISLLLSWMLGFFAFLLSFVLRNNHADPALSVKKSSSTTTKQIQEAPKDRSVSISVSQHSRISKPITKIVEDILSNAGVTVKYRADSSLTIEIQGTAQSGTYGFKGSTSGFTYYTGAVVNGTITYHNPCTKRRLSKSFYGTQELPESVEMSSYYTNPSAAPFSAAFDNSRFFSILVRMLRELYGAVPKVILGSPLFF